MGFQSFEERAKNDRDYIRRRLEIHGGYDKHGDVFGIARPLPGPVLLRLKKFHDAKAREQFIDEFTFFQYRDRCPSWRSVLFASDCFSDEEKSSNTLNGKSYTPEGGKAYVAQLIASGELVVYYTGSSIPTRDQNHHLPWRKPKAKEEFILVVQQPYSLGEHDEPGYVHPEKTNTMQGGEVVPDKINPQHLDLITSHPNAHAISVHGDAVTDAQLMNRARTGIKPNGDVGGIPKISTAFHSDELLVFADQAVRNNGGLASAIARNPGQTAIRVTVDDVGDLGVDLGRGFERLYGTGNKTANANMVGAPARIQNLQSVEGFYMFNPNTKIWETISIFPAPKL